VKLEEAYETDRVVLGVAGQKSGFFQKFGQSAPLDILLGQELTLTVNVGMGATDPDMRLQRAMQAFTIYNGLATQGSPDINLPEARKMIFGLAGFKDSSRLFTDANPQLVRAQQMMAEAEQKAKAVVDGAKDQLMRRERQLDEREHKMDIEMVDARNEFLGEAKKAHQEFVLDIAKQNGEHMLKERAQAHEMGMKRDKAAQEAQQAREKANMEAGLKAFEAKLEASLKILMGEVERKLVVAKTRTLEKQAPGKWKVTEH
jgi:hypothetical protein